MLVQGEARAREKGIILVSSQNSTKRRNDIADLILRYIALTSPLY